MADTSNLEFGRVLEGSTSDKKIWWLIIPAVLALGALLVFAGMALSKAGGLESKVRVAEQQAQEANKAVEERDQLLKKARADEAILRSPGQGVAVMASPQANSPATGVAVVHPEQKAVKLFVFGLKHPDAGQEYRAEAITADKQRAPLGAVIPDDRGTAFLLAKDLPEGASGIELVLGAATAAANGGSAGDPEQSKGAASAGDEPETTVILTGLFPKPGTAGVVQAPDVSEQAQARTPRRSARRPMR